MTDINPTYVSIYDFLYEDTKPLVPLLADIANLSLLQTQQALSESIQAITIALLYFHQRQHQHGDAILKKLFQRSSVKDLRCYNAMNFKTMSSAYHQRQTSIEALFLNHDKIRASSEYIAQKVDGKASNIQAMLATLTAIALRELAILTDYAQINGEEIDQWLALQPQFLAPIRFQSNATADQPPTFNEQWYDILEFHPTIPTIQTEEHSLPHYAKVIGRNKDNPNEKTRDVLMFATMEYISLPHFRWLLQLAKVSETYLGRVRLKIASEPAEPPSRPLVSFGSQTQAPSTASEAPIEYDDPTPFWKNPVILLVVFVLAGLSALALMKYQAKKSQTPSTTNIESTIQPTNQPQDIAIIKVHDDEESTQSQNNAQPQSKEQHKEKEKEKK